MKHLFKTLAVAFVATMTLASCEKENNNSTGNDDLQAQAIAAQFVDHTVAPTYSALATKAEMLASQLAALKENAGGAKPDQEPERGK